MSKGSFDPQKVSFRGGRMYYDLQIASQYRIRQYNRYMNGGSGRVTTISKRYDKYFSSGTKYTNSQGHLNQWAKPLSYSGGNDGKHDWQRAKYRDFNGNIRRIGSNERWGANVNRGKPGKGATVVLNGTKQWIKQILISMYQLEVNAENFRVVVGRRALKVFQNSFKYQQFYSNGASKWASLSAYTLRKRAKRGTGSKILKEYGDLYNSIKVIDNAGPRLTRLYTDVVRSNSSHHKKHSICYAGYHNEGQGTYGNGWNGHQPKPYIRRQFMGHSSHLDPATDNFIRKMMKLYLFDNVFLVKRV